MTKQVPRGDIDRQYVFMERVNALNDEYFIKNGRRRRFFIDTYGCQQNEADSETYRGMCLEMGYEKAESAQEAELVILNTCAVREHAEMRVFGNVGALSHAKRRNPDMLIAVCGCMSSRPEVREKLKKSFPYVDIVLDTHSFWRFPEILDEALSTGKRAFIEGYSGGAVAESLPKSRDGGVKAWLPVMYGCDNFCSYCIVPYVRGRERSRLPGDVLAEACRLVDSGVKDITLLGQNVNSYGRDLGPEDDFSSLIEKINAIPGDFRIRFMTSHPKDASKRLFDTMASCEKAARHLHLPFQSGSDEVLRRMNRGYTASHYQSLVAAAREAMPGIVLTSDVIVGFPGETEEDFKRTLELCASVRFDALFTFRYSKREGTKAAKMPDQIPKEVAAERFSRLLELQNTISAEIHASCVGSTYRVLVDGKEREGAGILSARTDGGRLVHFDGPEALIGSFAEVTITGSTTWSLFGKLRKN